MKAKNLFFLIMLLSLTVMAQTQQIGAKKVVIGDKTSVDKTLEFNINQGAANPKLKANATTNKLQFAQDGVNFKDVGSGSGSGSGINLLPEAGFEAGIAIGWSNTGGTYSAVTSGSNLLFGLISANFQASAAGQFFESVSVAIPENLKGQNCMAKIEYKGADANYYLTVMDGTSTEIIPTNARPILSTATLRRDAKVYFTCPTSGSIKLRVQSTAAGSSGFFDQAILGQSDEVPYKQSQMFGTARWAPVVGCLWNINGAGIGPLSSWNTATADNDCSNPILTGNALAPLTKLPAIRFSNAPAGTYKVTINGVLKNSANDTYFSITDGSSIGSARSIVSFSSNVSGNTLTSVFRYTNSQSSLEFSPVVNHLSGSPTGYIINDETTQEEHSYEIFVEYYPLESDLVVNSKCINDISCENSFTFSTNSTGTVLSESLDFINGNCTNPSTGIKVCTINSGIFNNNPSCTATVNQSNRSAQVTGTTTTSVTIETGLNGGPFNPFNEPVTVTCTKQGSDFKARQSIQGFFSSMLSPVGFSARQNSGQSIPSNVATTIVMNAEGYDSNNAHDTSTGVFTVPETANYSCSCRYSYASFNPGVVTLTAQIVKNGVLAAETYYTTTSSTNTYTQQTSLNDRLVLGDQIRCAAFQNSGASRALAANFVYNEFSCNKVGN